MVVEEPVDIFEKIQFCQTQPVNTVDGWKMARIYPDCIGKDMVSLLPLDSAASWRKWANDVGNSGLAIHSGVPILQEFYSILLRAGSGSFGDHPSLRNRNTKYLARGMASKRSEITPEARVSFWEAFGVHPDQQLNVESELAQIELQLDVCPEGNKDYKIQFFKEKTHLLFNILTQN
jgi:hypothetical protein